MLPTLRRARQPIGGNLLVFFGNLIHNDFEVVCRNRQLIIGKLVGAPLLIHRLRHVVVGLQCRRQGLFQRCGSMGAIREHEVLARRAERLVQIHILRQELVCWVAIGGQYVVSFVVIGEDEPLGGFEVMSSA